MIFPRKIVSSTATKFSLGLNKSNMTNYIKYIPSENLYCLSYSMYKVPQKIDSTQQNLEKVRNQKFPGNNNLAVGPNLKPRPNVLSSL